MRRRAFVAGMGSGALSPRLARAQRRVSPLVIYLTGIPLTDRPRMLDALRDGLGLRGFWNGQNISLEFVSADGRGEQLQEIASSIIARGPDLIIVSGPAPARAVAQLTKSTPIVFITGADPVVLGLVSSINRPGANVTGIGILTGDLNPKRLQLLREFVPRARRVAVMANPGNPVSDFQVRDVEQAGRALDLEIMILRAGSEREIAAVFDQMMQRRADAFLVNADPFASSLNRVGCPLLV